MKDYPKGTTREQWDRYYADLKAHEEYCERTKPNASNYEDADKFYEDLARWEMICFFDAPNKPGCYLINND